MSSVLPIPAAVSGTTSHRTSGTAQHFQVEQRPDIEGLRGIAVLSVLAVHTYPEWIRGGFIGVDIFFVLSGFLITGGLLKSLDAGRFSLLDFTVRRIRRIVPALCLMLGATLVFSAWLTYPADARQVGGHVAAASMFVSNLALWKEAGYFDVASQAKPLLHLWSLGIEAQFYLLWPLLVVVAHKRRNGLPWLIGWLLLGSFALNIAWVESKPTATFYLLPTRLWELVLGAALAAAHGRGLPADWLRWPASTPWSARRHRADALAATGLAMLLLAMALVDHTAHFPGWWALLPTLGTVALIAAGPTAWVNRHVLGQPVLRFYGAISYPLYLWHWPLLCFPVLLGVPMSHEVRALILIGSVVLGALTHEAIDKPIQKSRPTRRSAVSWIAVVATIGSFGALLNQSDGLVARYPTAMRGIAAAEFGFDYAEYRVDRCMLRLEQGPDAFKPECVDRRDPARKLLLLWGDSHAASLYPGLASLAAQGERPARLAQYTAARCPPLLPSPPQSHVRCDEINRFVLDRIAAERPDTVVLAGYWTFYDPDAARLAQRMNSLRDTVARLQSMGVQRVVVFGSLPAWRVSPPRLLLRHWDRFHSVAERNFDQVKPATLTLESIIEQAVHDAGAVFVSPTATLCNPAGCLLSVKTGAAVSPVAFDESHLSPAASALLVGEHQKTLLD